MSWFFPFRYGKRRSYPHRTFHERTAHKGKQTMKRKGMRAMEVRNINGHYEIYKDGKFVCSCDAGELREVVEEIGE